MPEHTVRLRKASGGAGLTYDGHEYSWPRDGSVTAVPYELALSLLAVPDGDYSVEGEPVPVKGTTDVAPASVQQAGDAGLAGSGEGEGDREVTEPAPEDERKVTEPAPKTGREASEGSRAPESGDGSKITPKPRAGTRRGTGK